MTKQRLLVLSQGSDKDPSYNVQEVAVGALSTKFKEFFHKRGIKLLEKDLVNSCHGNTEMTLEYARQIQALADAGHKVAAIQQGGLYFAKPSLEASNMPTVPVISIPLDGGSFGGLDAFLAPQIPTGTAVIGGVGVAKYSTAARFAAEILKRDFEGVYLFGAASKKTLDTLDVLGVPVLGSFRISNRGKEGIIIGSIDIRNSQGCTNRDDIGELEYYGSASVFSFNKCIDPAGAIDLMDLCGESTRSVYVRGEENLAYFAAKIISMNNPDVAENLKKAARNKAESYERRTITIDDFTLSGE